MIEKFSINYGDKKIDAVRSGVSNYYAMLPEKIDFQGKKLDGMVLKNNSGWMLMLGDRNDNPLLIYLDVDNNIAVQRGKDKAPVKGTFNPYIKQDTDLWKFCKIIHDVRSEIFDYEKLNVDTKKANDARFHNLVSMLKLIGYPSIDKVKYGTSTCTPQYLLREVTSKLEEFTNIGPYVTRMTTENGDVVECSNVSTGKEKQTVVLGTTRLDAATDDLSTSLEFRMAELEARRKIDKTYCAKKVRPMRREDQTEEDKVVQRTCRELALDTYGEQYKDLTEEQKRVIHKKASEKTGIMSYDEYKDYMDALEQTAVFVMRLYYDLLEDADKAFVDSYVARRNDRFSNPDLTVYQGIELGDVISEFIDSASMGRACNIEDRYVKRECEKLEAILGPVVPGSAVDEKSILRRTIKEEKDERTENIRKYDTLYAKPVGNGVPKVPKGLDDSDDDPIH